MMRNLKSLGLAFVAVLAMSAVVTSTVQAAPLFTGSGAANTATGGNAAGGEILTVETSKVECDSHFLVGAVGGGDIPAGGANQATVVPEYTGCTAFNFLNGTVHTNGCDYIFTATERINATQYRHHVRLDCPNIVNGAMVITGGTCEVDVPEKGNESLTTVTTTNLANGTVTVEPNVTNITVNVTQDGFGCPLNGTGHKTATYHGDVVISRTGVGTISVSGS